MGVVQLEEARRQRECHPEQPQHEGNAETLGLKAGRAPQGGKNAAGGKPNPKDARAGGSNSGNQGGVSKATQSSRKTGDG
jgi:hypothetical protein